MVDALQILDRIIYHLLFKGEEVGAGKGSRGMGSGQWEGESGEWEGESGLEPDGRPSHLLTHPPFCHELISKSDNM